MDKPVELLARLVGVEGLTAAEAPIVAEAAKICDDLDLEHSADAMGIVATVQGQNPGPTLLLCSHLDTVPAGEGWTVPPFQATIREGRLFGRGAVDARASCTAILLALQHAARHGLPAGRLVGILSVGEEGNHPSLPGLLEKIGPVDAGVVGEPTGMDIAVAQRGLIVLELTAHGKQGHAARSDGPNAALRLARDLVFLNDLQPPRWHPTLGQIKITPTRINAGVADNIVPPIATAMVDVRTTPSYSHDELMDIVGRAVESEVRVLADQWIPCETPKEHILVRTACAALPDGATYASDTTSDWVFLQQRKIPAVKIGPGNPANSHTADEHIGLDELSAGVTGYIRLVDAFFQTTGPGG